MYSLLRYSELTERSPYDEAFPMRVRKNVIHTKTSPFVGISFGILSSLAKFLSAIFNTGTLTHLSFNCFLWEDAEMESLKLLHVAVCSSGGGQAPTTWLDLVHMWIYPFL
jgi:hypothetical protein